MNRSGLIAVFLGVMLSFAGAESAEKEAAVDPVANLNREIMECRQKAVDLRVLGINALKNSDAAQRKAHDELIAAMGGSEPAAIDLARDLLEQTCSDLEDAVDDAGDLIGFVLKAEKFLRKADSAVKKNSEDSGSPDKIDLAEVKKLVKSAHNYLEKADKLAVDLKREWLEPFFVSTSTTTSTTTTTIAPEAAAVAKP